MATGDAAAAAGIPVVPSTKDLRLGYNDINALADQLANREAALNARVTPLETYKNTTPTPKVIGGGGLASNGAALTSSTPIIIQAGSLVVNLDASGLASIAWPSTFPNGILTVQLTNGDAGVRPNMVVGHTVATQTGCTAQGSGGAGNVRINYFAIGW